MFHIVNVEFLFLKNVVMILHSSSVSFAMTVMLVLLRYVIGETIDLSVPYFSGFENNIISSHFRCTLRIISHKHAYL